MISRKSSGRNVHACGWIALALVAFLSISSFADNAVPTNALKVDMRFLLISASGNDGTEPALGAARARLDAQGILCDEFMVTSTTSNRALKTGTTYTGDITRLLVDPNDAKHGNYQVIIVTSYRLSGISEAQWLVVEEYCRTFGVRIVYLMSKPAASIGTNDVASSSSAAFNFKWDATTAAAYTNGYKMETAIAGTAAHYLGVSIVNSADCHALANIVDGSGVSQGVALMERTLADGLQEIHSFADHTASSLYSILTLPCVINWASRNLYSGVGRIWLSTQIDDLFLDTQLYDVQSQATGTNAFRIVGSDIDELAAFTTFIRTQMPAGSTYTPEWAFNGGGVDDFGGKDVDALYTFGSDE
eukprot:TRINITY_DN3136_c0_g5_i1.p1 TRINITY_DN3136_c0_g5~~TRINITY_DN3136_c0_g5_i1.p1  ORF type:complete len:360 (+),score=71.53 TRINITY_DN3136_c0_g5_i1:46-1125(+)